MRRVVAVVTLGVVLLAGCAGTEEEPRAEAPGVPGTTPSSAPAADADAVGTPGEAGLDGTVDSDGDLLSDAQEAELGTDPHEVDTDGDGISDVAELVSSLTDPTLASTDGRVPDGRSDLDGDGLGYLREQALGTDPLAADTDGDDLDDAEELAAGTDPLLADTDGDGVDDGLELAGGLDPLTADTDGTVALRLESGDVTVVAEGSGEAVGQVYLGRGDHVGWDGSPVVLTETVQVHITEGVDSLRIMVESAGLRAAPEDVGIIVDDTYGSGALAPLDTVVDAAAGTVSATWDVPADADVPLFAIIDQPAWLALFE